MEVLISPTISYVKKVSPSRLDILKEIDVGSELENRLYYGYTISELEFEKEKIILKSVRNNMYQVIFTLLFSYKKVDFGYYLFFCLLKYSFFIYN